ncbi:MAG: type 1 glutamine amidotransferase, partial [Archaeoglobaceae archaeon]
MRVLILKNSPLEGPGTLEEFLRQRSAEYKVVEVALGEKIPPLDEHEYLVVLGGPMGVYEMDKYPFLKDVSLAMEKALDKGIKILGICLGAQLFAHVLGSRVYPSKAKEIGWSEIKATPEGMKDDVFKTILEPSGKATVFQWHGDTYDLPHGAVRLASSELFPEQAFKYGDSYALQFHIEITLQMMRDWFSESETL